VQGRKKKPLVGFQLTKGMKPDLARHQVYRTKTHNPPPSPVCDPPMPSGNRIIPINDLFDSICHSFQCQQCLLESFATFIKDNPTLTITAAIKHFQPPPPMLTLHEHSMFVCTPIVFSCSVSMGGGGWKCLMAAVIVRVGLSLMKVAKDSRRHCWH
jgi:hypothetical protein